MNEFLNLLGFFVALLWSFFSSGSETALYRTSRVRMRLRLDRGSAAAGMVNAMLDRLGGMVTAILISNNIANYLGAYFLTVQLMALRAPQYELLTTLVVTPVFFVLGESLPKQLAYNHADAWSLAVIRALSAMRAALAPAICALNAVSAALRLLLRIKGGSDLSESRRSRLLEHLEAGVAEKILTAEQNSMARRIIEIEGLTASALMVPTWRIPILPERATRARAAAAITARKASFALLADSSGRTTDRAVTINLLIQIKGRPADPVRDIAPALGKLSAGTTLPEILAWLRRGHAQRAAVEDHGRIIGVITTGSILDRIAGSGY
ncbi:MAG: CNNM domain-containing protein [Planctomycetota bacterium]|nr:CNNM domain-containing protein [Planctomycetota bacterium]